MMKMRLLKLKFWINVEEYTLKKKEGIFWLKVGDNNTQFFHHALKEKTLRNKIEYLLHDDGNTSYEE